MQKRIFNFLLYPLNQCLKFLDFMELMQQENDKRLQDEIRMALDLGDVIRAEELNRIRLENLGMQGGL